MSSTPPVPRRVVAPITVRDQLVTYFKRTIDDGRYRDGERLPPRRALMADLGVSAETLNNVFRDLRREGYVTTLVGSGTTVVGPSSRSGSA